MKEEAELVEEYTWLVHGLAYDLHAKNPYFYHIEDFRQEGFIGLIHAIRNYDDTKGASLQTYARFRIRGCIIDHMRQENWASRQDHKDNKGTENEQLMYMMSADYFNDQTGKSVDLIERTEGDMIKPDDEVIADQLFARVQQYESKLVGRDRRIWRMRFHDRMTFKEIGKAISRSEALASHIVMRLLKSLEKQL